MREGTEKFAKKEYYMYVYIIISLCRVDTNEALLVKEINIIEEEIGF